MLNIIEFFFMSSYNITINNSKQIRFVPQKIDLIIQNSTHYEIKVIFIYLRK